MVCVTAPAGTNLVQWNISHNHSLAMSTEGESMLPMYIIQFTTFLRSLIRLMGFISPALATFCKEIYTTSRYHYTLGQWRQTFLGLSAQSGVGGKKTQWAACRGGCRTRSGGGGTGSGGRRGNPRHRGASRPHSGSAASTSCSRSWPATC